MNTHTLVKEVMTSTTTMQIADSDIDTLTQCAYSADELLSLLWLRQHYQTGGSDRATIVRYLEFLRQLVMSGKLEA